MSPTTARIVLFAVSLVCVTLLGGLIVGLIALWVLPR